jgi:hypothetical protein
VSAERKAVLSALGQAYHRFWLVLDTTPEADEASTTERWLDKHAYRVGSQWVSPAMRLVQYVSPHGEGQQELPLDLRLGKHLRLDSFALACDEPPGTAEGKACPPLPLRVPSGQVLPFSLFWRTERAIQEDYTVFVQLLDESGKLHVQLDRQPVGGFRPTSTWQPAEVIADKYGLGLPADLVPGRYRLIVGLYLPASMERLAVTTDEGVMLGDHVFLTDVIVVEGDGP